MFEAHDFMSESEALRPDMAMRHCILLIKLIQAIKESRRLPSDTGSQEMPAEAAAAIFNEFYDLGPNTSLLFAEGVCTVNGEPIRVDQGAGELITELRQQLQILGLGGLSVRNEVETEDVIAMLLAWRDMPETDPEERYQSSLKSLTTHRHKLKLKGASPIGYISLSKIDQALVEQNIVLPPSRRRATLLFSRLLARTRATLDRLSRREPAPREIAALQRTVTEVVREIDNDVFRSRLLAWTTLRGVERVSVQHNVCAAVLAICAGRELGYDRTRLHALGMATILHDTVNIPGLPQGHRLWSEPTHTALVSDSFSRSILYRMVLPYEQLKLHVLDLPSLADEDPLFESHLMGVACAFDRSVRDAYLPPYQALRACSESDDFEPAATSAFTAALGVHPRGSVVRLDDGHLAVVLENGRYRLHRPLVRLLENAQGRAITEPIFADLLDPKAPRVVGALDERNLGLDIGAYVLAGTGPELDPVEAS